MSWTVKSTRSLRRRSLSCSCAVRSPTMRSKSRAYSRNRASAARSRSVCVTMPRSAPVSDTTGNRRMPWRRHSATASSTLVCGSTTTSARATISRTGRDDQPVGSAAHIRTTSRSERTPTGRSPSMTTAQLMVWSASRRATSPSVASSRTCCTSSVMWRCTDTPSISSRSRLNLSATARRTTSRGRGRSTSRASVPMLEGGSERRLANAASIPRRHRPQIDIPPNENRRKWTKHISKFERPEVRRALGAATCASGIPSSRSRCGAPRRDRRRSAKSSNARTGRQAGSPDTRRRRRRPEWRRRSPAAPCWAPRP